MIWLGILIGIIAMQLATLIIAYVTRENENLIIIFSIFLFYPLIRLLQIIIQWSKNRNRK